MKKLFVKIWIFAFVITSASCVFSQQLLDRIVAIVDDEIILESEITQMAWMMSSQMGIDPTKDKDKFNELRKLAVQNLVNKELLVIQADKDTIQADERQVEAYLNQQMQSIIQQVGGEDKLEEALGMPMSRLRRNYRDEIEKDLRASAVQDQKLTNVTISRREVTQFYKTMKDSLGKINETVNLSHILVEIKAGEKARMEAMEKIINIRKQLLEGKDFAQLARDFSDDPGSAARGGDLGFMSRDDFVREYAEAAYLLNPGEISDIVETQFGFHIIELFEKRGDKIHTRHILVSIKPTKEDEIAAAEKIKDIHRQLKEGANFEELVLKYSDDESSKGDSGHLGMNDIEQLKANMKEFVYALQDVKPGEISDPVRTQYGFHIIKLLSREPARNYDFERDYETLQNIALNYKKQKELQKWIQQIKKDVYVEYKDQSLM